MKTGDSETYDWLDDRIEAYLDDALDASERLRFEQMLDEEAGARQELTRAIRIRDELRALPTPAVSAHLEKAILKEVRREAWADYRSRLMSGLGGVFTPGGLLKWRSALATLVLLVAAVVFLVVSRPFSPPAPGEQAISQAEVDQALLEAKWALGYVSKTGRLAGTSMQDALAPIMKERNKE